MSFDACLTQLESDGTIDRARAARMRALYGEMEDRFTKQYGAGPGAVMAGEEALRALDYDATLRRRQAALQIDAQRRGYADMERFDKGSGAKDEAAVIAMMARDDRAPYSSVESRTEQLEFQAHAQLSEFIEKHQRNLVGQVRNKASLMDVLRERHGQASGNAEAKAFSDAIGELFEGQRQHFNLLGGDIGFDAKYGLTHRHDARRVRLAGFEQWRGDIMPELDVARMIDPVTGQPFSAAGLEDALAKVHENIRTDGLAGLGSSDGGGAARKLANRRSDARFLQFKDGDAWLRYNEKYGTADPFSAIMGQISGMNRDLALLERLGPNPDATMRFLKDQAKRRIAQSDDASPHALNRAQAVDAKVDKVWRVLNGDANIPVLGGPIRSNVVKGLHAARDLLTAAKLGKAVFTTLGDLATVKSAKAFNGMPATSDMLGYLRQLNPLDASDRKMAVQLELGMRDATAAMFGMNRFFAASQGPAITKVIADTSLRITGLNHVTEAGQRHFGLSFLASLAHERGKGFGEVEPKLRGALERYGIDASTWDAIRQAPVHSERGGEWMSGKLVRQADPAAADRLMDMVLSETAAAVQMTTMRGRALTHLGNPGTFGGEAGAALFQFKGFTASLMLTQGMRMTGMGAFHLGAAYFGRLFITMTLFGAATIQLRQLSYGQDLRPMDNKEFWIDAMLQSGGLGIFGDVIGSFERQGKSGLAGVISGPLVGAGAEVGSSIVSNVKAVNQGADTHALRDLNEFARRNTPGSNTWYLSLAFQRLIFDQIRAEVDPDYPASVRRMERKANSQGAGFWWNPGETAPSRAPDLTTMYADPEGSQP